MAVFAAPDFIRDRSLFEAASTARLRLSARTQHRVYFYDALGPPMVPQRFIEACQQQGVSQLDKKMPSIA
jgi:hypothetical protein